MFVNCTFEKRKSFNIKLGLFFIILLMFYTSYLTFILIIASFFSLLLANFKQPKKILGFFIEYKFWILFFGLLSLPQLFPLLKFQLQHSGSQIFSIPLSFIFTSITIFIGNSSFPFQLANILYLISLLFIFYLARKNLIIIFYNNKFLFKFFSNFCNLNDSEYTRCKIKK